MSTLRRGVALAARRLAVVLALALAGCADSVGSGAGSVGLVIVPEFGDLAVFADNADQLRIVITRVADSTVMVDDTVPIDPVSGTATATFTVQLGGGPEAFRILLQAVRSGDGVILFEGVETVTVSSASGSEPVAVPVSYAGPRGASIVVSPRDTAIALGTQFTFAAVVRDTAQQVVAAPVTYQLLTPADSTILRVQKYTGLATAGAGPTTGTVRVVARSADGLTDTARVSVGAVPARIRVQPGFGIVAVSGTLALSAELLDAAGVVIGPVSTATWTSRSTGIATVASTGVVTAAAAGTAVIVGTSGTFSDSIIVRVPSGQGEVPFAAFGNGRSFARPRAGDTVVVDVTADMNFIGGELLGSYNAQLTWTPSFLRYVSTAAGNFGAPTVNDTQATSGTLRFSAANATGVGGTVVVARIRFVAQSPGTSALQLAVTEVSAAQTFTNLLTFRTVTNGSVTVRP